MYLTDEEIRTAYIVKLPHKTPDGFTIYVHGKLGDETTKVCFTGESIDPRFACLFQAAPIMYQTIVAQMESMRQFEKVLTEHGATALAADIGNMCEALRMSLKVATHGVEQVVPELMGMATLQAMKPNGKAN